MVSAMKGFIGMSGKSFIDEFVSWFQKNTVVMFLFGIAAVIGAFAGAAQFKSGICICSGLINVLTGLGDRYVKLRVGNFANMGQMLALIGMFAAVIGIFNMGGNPSAWLPVTSFATGLVAIVAFVWGKISMG